ncbi:hypothetical protein [Streptomyces sp. HB132]|nr:hypothetical protein [Streptomyces sp. HB132]MBM7442076.1 hypothetical protein [Streptomyces sp. HB132]
MHSDTALLRRAGLPVTDLTPILAEEPCPLLFASTRSVPCSPASA